MTNGNHHVWCHEAANRLFLGSDDLWQALCAEWAARTQPADLEVIVEPIREALE
jgi:hypothetical protein